MKDIRIDTYRAQGAGGQHVNKTDSACRAVHIPTGIMAQCQDSRDQAMNKQKALDTLRNRLYQAFHAEGMAEDQARRKEQKGSGNLGDKIRSYNWPNNRITDHRIGVQKFGLDQMFAGELLAEFIEELIDNERDQALKDFLN